MYNFDGASSEKKSEVETIMIIDSSDSNISSNPSYSDISLAKFQWDTSFFPSKCYDTPPPKPSQECSLAYQENIKLRHRIEHLEQTLKKSSLKNSPENQSFMTYSTHWFLTQDPDEKSVNYQSIARNLQQEFNMVSNTDFEKYRYKRFRPFYPAKKPQKFIKLAMMSNIGTLNL